MKRELTPEQKKIFRDYYIDRAKTITGQVLVVVFGVLMPAMTMLLRRRFLPLWLNLAIAGIGLVLILTSKAAKDAEAEEKRWRR